jgi:hypothetical protein
MAEKHGPPHHQHNPSRPAAVASVAATAVSRLNTSAPVRDTDRESLGSTVYSIQGRMGMDPSLSRLSSTSSRPPEELLLECAPPRLCRGHLPGEEILIAEYPHQLRSRSRTSIGGMSSAGSSIHRPHQPPGTGQYIASSSSIGILDDPPSSTASASDYGGGPRRIQWTSRHAIPSGSIPPGTPGIRSSQQQQQSAPAPQGILRKPQPPRKEPPEDSGEEEDAGEEASEEDSYELYSPLDKADLVGLSKSQIIEMWRASELDLRRQLSQALKAKDQLASQINSRAQTPAMLLEFDQVKI